MIRRPIVAGRFYPGEADACRKAVAACLTGPVGAELPGRLVGGIVPHAGWMCSGAVAGRVFSALAARPQPETVVLLGAVHRWPGRLAAMYDEGHWRTPLGDVAIDAELAGALRARSQAITAQPQAHAEEHSLEVQVPFVQYLFPHTRILPIMVPPSATAEQVGEDIAAAIEDLGRTAAVVGTTDLTHYGPSYGFTPEGAGPAGLRWAKEVNDARIIRLVEAMAASEIVPEAMRNHNACGPGAVAAVIAAARKRQADRAVVLEHTTSAEVLGGPASDAVGYVGVVFGNN